MIDRPDITPEAVERFSTHLRYVVSDHAQRLINRHFNNDGVPPHISIPANPKEDSDLIVHKGIVKACEIINALSDRVQELEAVLLQKETDQ